MTSAAIAADRGLSVLVVEKSDKFGGTSAISGGGIWIPNNHYFAAKGGKDSYDKALQYIMTAGGGRADETKVRAYLDHAPAMIKYLEDKSRVRYAVAEKYPDYYQHVPGSLPGGRSLDPELFDTSVLGDELENLRRPSPSTLLMGKISWTARDAHIAMARESGWRFKILWMMLRYKLDFKWRRKSKFDRRAGLGNSLVCALRASLLDRKVPLWLNTDFRDFVLDNGRVTGIKVVSKGRELTLNARRGVIIGAGGFEQNQTLREKYLPQPTKTSWSATPPGNNTGAALEAGMAAGAATDLLEWAWWSPTIPVVGEEKPRGIFAERAFPGSIVVNGLGKRFCNEAQGYLEFGDAMYKDREATGGKNVPAWCIFDAHFRFNYAMGPLMPGQIMPDSRLRKEWRNSVYWKADTLEELARQIDVDPAGLATTVKTVNEYARTGEDKDFGRGGNVFDRYYGDVNVKPNPCLAPIQKGPFYAMRMDAGDIGTKGGLLTDAHARVVRPDGSPIEGLYAIGNTSASVMGIAYPGAGATIGPAMTFGYIAAHHIADNT
ncbi:MAG: FAD-binding protein [Thauera sp.]|nr:FAD-binding protein [Thauera sp.]